ncbi:unnamed protein product [Adineta steineri]|uniref:Uncharacterized protein n=1 Tax=Adineta steineri TaxID=433720 RepID=A0A815USU9_9BILA|nr:unnamed protein product [Adineta steineri]CAF1523471.1 unnamed protein product [Adineta steineri]CAF1523507.1 unnamed protein product [Adineta steineri]CAF1651053.1 unnamed protein product [Adineta steineri]CAF1651063.1 unnamed protein product [Adineta steineri]
MPFQSSFSIRKTKPRKLVSRSPFQLPAEELARELGPRYEIVDVRIGNQKLVYDIPQGKWISGGMVGTSISSREINKLEKTKQELEEDNHVLRAKIDMLTEMLAEITAEYEVRRGG